MNTIKRYMKTPALLFCVAATFFACSKDGGYYNAANNDPQFAGNTYDYLKSKPGVYDSLIAVVDRMGLKPMLTDSNVTLFAVTNPSFQLAITNLNTLRRQSDKDPLYLSNIDGVHLDTMASYYIIRGRYTSDSLTLQDGLDLPSVRFAYPMHGKLVRNSASGNVNAGPVAVEFSNTKRSKFIRNWSTTTTGSNNIITKNGIVHVVSPDHIFGFDEFVTRLTFVPPPPNLMLEIGGKLSVLRDNAGGPDNGEGSKKVIDGDDHTKFLAEFQGRLWMQYELKEPAVSGVYTLISANDAPDRDPRAWTYEGSMDGKTWVELDRRSNFFFEERYQTKVFRCDNTVAYKFYRIDISEINGSGAFQLAEWTINRAN
ncbi:fasciclin domain-containing protein [Mucilaginibacter roseus]|uniref:Fasciclin domain-containing protein n=1 Tax=Mucilaginibacter roseus TaxID=1528868 RepID=A0ABS8TXK1_9SPHI|nr:fasciclin domain-containing protein [Mucilaginibacter roseus]MCD8739609.1 fasciclin domain-containing protein [Mucilaginibacter roseus]